ncbi:hypothetical protein [Aeoliella mucimassa]|uniref:Uncharacterized protein n=1 Tax=Aeoliella mucimassa TaxID=2527972 RepID=A0A518AQZ0_9BACT|nr:hypothetical protein [Aeoliella mucimassa]QDU57133.1 hypothetical protein Pan181_33470 [Aeoliella mucimassa]
MTNCSTRPIEWQEGEQRLTKGWLSSRTPTQFLVVEPKKVAEKLEVRLGSKPRAESSFQHGAELVLVQDDEGDWYSAENTPTGEVFSLSKIDRTKAVTLLRKTLRDREPQLPAGLDSVDGSSILWSGNRRYRYYRRNGVSYEDSLASNSLLMTRWEELLGVSGTPALDLPARSYVMVSDSTLVPVEKNLEAVEDSSVHLVIGRW